MKKLCVILVAIMCCCICTVKAANHPDVRSFGKYGFPYHSNINQYQEMVGKIVMYIPEYTPSYNDKTEFNGKFNTPYVITKIKGKDSRMTIYLSEKEGDSKAKIVVNNKDEYYSYGKYTYCITPIYTIPLLLIDEMQKEKNNMLGKEYPTNTNSPRFKITDLVTYNFDKKGYPSICYEITELQTGNKSYVSAKSKKLLSLLGAIYSNDRVKATYEVIGLLPGKQILRNSITSAEKVVDNFKQIGKDFTFARDLCFEDDLVGKYVATLSKVEKPQDPNIRYGETKQIEDNGISKYSYVDNNIEIIIYATSQQFNFSLKNVSNTSLKIIWNEAVYVDSNGSTSKIMHVGTKYSEREGDQPATTIIKGAKIDDLACPTKNIRYSDLLKEWTTDSMFPTKGKQNLDPIRLMLPIQIKDTINEYIFEFDVNYEYLYPDRLKPLQENH